MCKIFKNSSLQINIVAYKNHVDFKDITLDLRTAIYKPYKKPIGNLTHIHKQSNHPPSIIKNLPKNINKRLSTNSKNAQVFNEACPSPPPPPTLHRTPTKNGNNTNLQFDRTCTDKNNEKNKETKRENSCFSPPFNINVATNFSKIILTLIDTYFPKDK